ncbi:RNA helicase/RNAse III, putative [Aspergillus lentulus]|uniref:RNA helicase/RNAse III, putative n=1 Tax=Aspergillus lentulus TaxID=293939 RepID=A0ABQ0ZZI4_ASPLE|nr:RNA helicase/RNAse III, putative [Aspergillus lentulus]GFF69863.1 RNA helicase/RNAse III, putative [Aspergillus lentulus]GFF82207.1 RNA helicase/RNAse III, putative [Aspergillus lentulus]GFG05311.1 RNA helicase/RNAse III, putative [Aspergillus lentulus]
MASTVTACQDASPYQPRNYQLEMLEASMKENIIVAMDTGSGKTHIAVLRIKAELDICPPHKLVWFLAPTVALCIQQHEVIASNLPAVRTRTLTGLDKVELWTEQSVWDAILNGYQVIVSTHAVLADALSHGFVKMSRLALLIFDEAHHCTRRHTANKIMRDFYHPTLTKSGPVAVPRIMGLTASPVVRSNHQELLTVESNLDAVCRTPRVHRQELLKFTHRPHLQQIWYTPTDPTGFKSASQTLGALSYAWETLDIEDDPYIQRLRKSPLDNKALQKALLTGKTYCREQLRRFIDRSRHIFEELGEWAAEYYVYASIKQLRDRVRDSYMSGDWDEAEKAYLVDFLSRIPASETQPALRDPESFRISPKFESLLNFLDSLDEPEFSGLIFVKQRATVSAMSSLLSVHPSTRERFRCAAYVGWSNGSASKDILGDLLNMQLQRDTLDDFRSGRKNLIIATDVLEEGIDISACSVVVCYDKPPNLKSFVQRRGRARRKQSTFAIMFPADDVSSDVSRWQGLEQAMIEAYQDDERQLQSASALESLDEKVTERLTVESTSAVLTADMAMAHLHHFCAVLPPQPYVDMRPVFSFQTNEDGLLKGTVILPSCVHPKVRRTEGRRWWHTERAAMKETAFQAYKALYEFRLVNDNLLPLTKKPELKSHDLGAMPSILETSGQYDPWIEWAYSWSSPDIHQSRIVVRMKEGRGDELCMRLMGPTYLPPLSPMTLFWDNSTTFTVTFEAAERVPLVPLSSVEDMRAITALYLEATSSRVCSSERDFTALFAPDLHHTELKGWLNAYEGCDPATEVYTRGHNPLLMGVVRDHSRYGEPFLFRKWLVSDQNPSSSVVELECAPFPNRRNLVHRQTLANSRVDVDVETPESAAKIHIVAADACTIDRLPFTMAIFGLFISAIVDRLEIGLIATRLRETILRDVGFTSTDHIITAISTPFAHALTNYQRYEFLGDSILKFSVSCQLFFQHPNWHEGYLSEGRTMIVQNPRLAKAALDTGLDAYIVTKNFASRKWSAPLISEKLERVPAKRQMSTKVLADVVEALIGAAYMDGGHATAQACIHRLLPEVNLHAVDTRTATRSVAPESARHMMNDRLKDHIGYTFEDESLLVEALTHPSCDYDSTTQSYQRLEYLGDAVLDMVIVSAIFNHPIQRPQGDMTKIKHAVVNANLLAFLCMEFAISEEKLDVAQTSKDSFAVTSSQESVELWRFMRYRGQDLNAARDASLARHRALRDEIASSLQQAPHYPWHALSRLSPDKFFSDIVESVLGAIFVDSGGDLAPCEVFVERIGLMAYLRRILDHGIDVRHPRSVAQQLAKANIQFVLQRVPNEEGGASYQCSVRIEEAELFVVTGCLTAEEAEVTAAVEAIKFLTLDKGSTPLNTS